MDQFEPRSSVAKFKEYHGENPNIYELFKRFALDAVETGRPRFSARMIGERIRWYTTVETRGDSFKVNDHYWPFYARLFVRDHPQYCTMFEFRGALGDELLIPNL